MIIQPIDIRNVLGDVIETSAPVHIHTLRMLSRKYDRYEKFITYLQQTKQVKNKMKQKYI